jgi:ketosteroid isomerase-like protein
MANAEEEVRNEFEEWLAAAGKKDLDAVMTKIDDDIVSYEHDAPLQYRGAAAVREVCRQGFEAMAGEFSWDIPDLQIIIRDDIAVTWGLNRMTAKQAGQDEFESWSRGTRIFQRKADGWKLIHQHVSYPYDPETGEAKLLLRP